MHARKRGRLLGAVPLLTLWLAGCGGELHGADADAGHQDSTADATDGDAPAPCASDGMLCPDGTTVGRDPDNGCEFFACPAVDSSAETIVALWNGVDELRILDSSGTLIAAANLPNRIEAMDVGDIDDDGALEVATGLDGTSDAQLRLFELNPVTLELEETIVSGILAAHIEGIAIGDADNDDEQEIVAVLEGGASIVRVHVYDFVDGAWIDTAVSTPDSMSAQDVKIADVDENGQNEIIALMASPGASGTRQVRAYRKQAAVWTMEEVTPLVDTPPRGAERLVVADADGDGDVEIVTAYHSYQADPNLAVIIDREGGAWVEEVIADHPGDIDAIDVGDFDGDAEPDVIMGQWSSTGRVHKIEYDAALDMWQSSFISPSIGYSWDAAVGDADNDGQNEVLIANDSQLLKLESADPSATVLVATFPVSIDSVMVADIVL